MHHSPKTTSRSTSPHLQHRVQTLNLLDECGMGMSMGDMGLGMGAGGGGASTITGHLISLYPPTMSTVNQQTSTTSSLIDAQYHNQYQQTGGSLLDHPLTPTKFRQLTSTSSQTGQNGNGFGYDQSQAQSQGQGSGSGQLYRQQSSCSANFTATAARPSIARLHNNQRPGIGQSECDKVNDDGELGDHRLDDRGILLQRRHPDPSGHGRRCRLPVIGTAAPPAGPTSNAPPAAPAAQHFRCRSCGCVGRTQHIGRGSSSSSGCSRNTSAPTSTATAGRRL